MKVRAHIRAPDGSPAHYETVLSQAVKRLRAASAASRGCSLSAEMVRALDWAVIRESGGLDPAEWRALTPTEAIRKAEGR